MSSFSECSETFINGDRLHLCKNPECKKTLAKMIKNKEIVFDFTNN